MYEIVFYESASGNSPVEEFLESLDDKTEAKVAAVMALLEEKGPNLYRPYADQVHGKIRELRIRFSRNQVRVLHFFQRNKQIVMLHAIQKKRSDIPKKDIELAETRMEDWIKRHK